MILPNFTELRIYPSFTEIRQEYNTPKDFKMYFCRDVFTSISPDSSLIEGIQIESKQFITKANNLENQTIFVQRHSNIEAEECRVIQGDDLLLQDINIPEQEGTEIKFNLKNQGKATLTYQIHGDAPLTIREQGRLVALTNLPDMAIGDKYILTSGQDSDVSLNRQVKLISKERYSATYAIHLTLKNVKSTSVKFELIIKELKLK
ncbi:unnamed protein product [Adineta steineri]|uniref:Uncharacterized protein n=1 Tax=Adineta steineri TaxID=433720 RepID=A0A815E1Q8_9BILA|nr:unnamed protein product [Adineta steineri]